MSDFRKHREVCWFIFFDFLFRRRCYREVGHQIGVFLRINGGYSVERYVDAADAFAEASLEGDSFVVNHEIVHGFF